MQTSEHFIKVIVSLGSCEISSTRVLEDARVEEKKAIKVINNSSCSCLPLSERFEEKHKRESIIKKAARAL